jgi:HD-GYP domain-containing protein (c-di-GMP phosphodiesterase class II)
MEKEPVITEQPVEQAVKQGVDNVKRALIGMVNALATLGELLGIYAEGHPERVARLAPAIACNMGFSEDEIEGVRVMGLLHDIGKAVVPREILCKPVGLSMIEIQLIRQHPGAFQLIVLSPKQRYWLLPRWLKI